MKKIIALALCLCLMFCFVSCKDTKQKQIGTDVQFYAKSGQIPELPYKLGDDVDKIIAELDNGEEDTDGGENGEIDHEHPETDYLGMFENGANSVIAVTGANYCFDVDNKSDGINRIFSFGGGYGFENGALIPEIKECMESYGHKALEREPDETETNLGGFYSDTTCLFYQFEKNAVAFFFQESALCAVMISR